MTHIVHKYDDIASFLAAVASRRDASGASSDFSYGFHLHESLEQAMSVCRDGWSTERPKVDAMLTPLREKLSDRIDIVSNRVHDLVGYEPDIDRFLDGEMECMWEDMMTEAPRTGNVYTLLLSGSVSSAVSVETVLKRGVAIIGLVEAFQMCGAELEIWVENSCTSGGYSEDSWSSLVRVCRAGENPDINTLMFPLGNPDWQRRFSFGLREGEPQDVRRKFGFTRGGGYGSTADLLCVDIVNPSFTLSKGGTATNTRLLDTDPVAWILATLEAQGVYTPAE